MRMGPVASERISGRLESTFISIVELMRMRSLSVFKK